MRSRLPMLNRMGRCTSRAVRVYWLTGAGESAAVQAAGCVAVVVTRGNRVGESVSAGMNKAGERELPLLTPDDERRPYPRLPGGSDGAVW